METKRKRVWVVLKAGNPPIGQPNKRMRDGICSGQRHETFTTFICSCPESTNYAIDATTLTTTAASSGVSGKQKIMNRFVFFYHYVLWTAVHTTYHCRKQTKKGSKIQTNCLCSAWAGRRVQQRDTLSARLRPPIPRAQPSRQSTAAFFPW